MGKLRINMRELKFRYWNPIAKTYKMSWRYSLTHDGKILAYDVDMMGYDEPTDPKNSILVIQQYTGLKDRHEKEIYEGDIVKIIYDEAVAEVYFDFNLGAFRLKDNSGKSYPITTYRFDESNKPIGLISVVDEVVGNIMENPELLK